MKVAVNNCCDNYIFNEKALKRLNQLLNENNLPLMDEYNDYEKWKNLRYDPNYVKVVEEFDGDVLGDCRLDVFDIELYPRVTRPENIVYEIRA